MKSNTSSPSRHNAHLPPLPSAQLNTYSNFTISKSFIFKSLKMSNKFKVECRATSQLVDKRVAGSFLATFLKQMVSTFFFVSYAIALLRNLSIIETFPKSLTYRYVVNGSVQFVVVSLLLVHNPEVKTLEGTWCWNMSRYICRNISLLGFTSEQRGYASINKCYDRSTEV